MKGKIRKIRILFSIIITEVQRYNEEMQKRRETSYQEMIKKVSTFQSEKEKIVYINRFWNRYKYVPDIKNHGIKDYWTTVDEFIKKGTGDCEDYAIAKMISLIKTGVEKEKLRLLIVREKSTKSLHVVTLYKNEENEKIILDNKKMGFWDKNDMKKHKLEGIIKEEEIELTSKRRNEYFAKKTNSSIDLSTGK